MENEQDRAEYTSHILDPDFGARIAATVQAEVARSLEGLDIGAEVAKSLEELDIGTMVHDEIEKAMSKIEHKMARARDRAERAQEKAHRIAEKMARHQEKMHQAAERMAHRHERTWHAEQKAHRVDVAVDEETQADGPRARQVSEEEQLSILRMLQEGTITTEQADMLLKALAG